MRLAERLAEDRVRKHTAPEVNRRIDEKTALRIQTYAQARSEMISHRLAELDREWDMERVLQTNAATLALSGSLLGLFVNRRWLLLPAFVSAFLLQHAIQGWCPPVGPLRRLGVRTRKEIEKERYALKLLRGDFDGGTNAAETRDVTKLLASLER